MPGGAGHEVCAVGAAPWFYTVALTLQSVALYKTEEQEAVRSLGLAHPFFKVIHREVVQQNRVTIQ